MTLDPVLGMRALAQVLANLALDLTDWNLQVSRVISDDGFVIVGNGTNPSGFPEAWIAVIPEPGTGSLVLLGLAALGIRRRRGW